MEENSINGKKIDWAVARIKVLEAMVSVKTIEDSYPGVTEALRALEDNHSSYIKRKRGVLQEINAVKTKC
jgi:hypothetical protein